MPHPTSRLILLLCLPALVSLIGFGTNLLPLILIIDGICLAILLVDALAARRAIVAIELHLRCPRTWSLNRGDPVTAEVIPNRAAGRMLRLALDLPPELVPRQAEARLDPLPPHRVDVEWQITPRQRGSHQIPGIHLALRSRAGFWLLHRQVPAPVTLQVYPNLRQLAEYELLARTNRLNLIGIRRTPRLGGENEFDSLRDYRVGDSLKVIDWKATARRHALTSRDFTISQAQNLMIMIDAGRMMGAQLGDELHGTLLDGAINSALMLAHVARRQGDLVGIIVYDRAVIRFLPPASNPRQINRIVHALHDVHVAPWESRHDLAFLHLSRHCHKRSLLIQLTHVLDQVNTDALVHQLSLLAHRHLPLAVLFRDPDCHQPLAAPPATTDDFYRAAAAAAILNGRNQAIDRLRTAGVLTLDCHPRDLTSGLISRYLHIKAQNML